MSAAEETEEVRARGSRVCARAARRVGGAAEGVEFRKLLRRKDGGPRLQQRRELWHQQERGLGENRSRVTGIQSLSFAA